MNKVIVFIATLIFGCGFLTNASANCLRYGDIVTILSGKNHKFLVAEPNGNTDINRSNAAQWEVFLLLNEDGKFTETDVQFGDKITLKSNHGKYLVAEPNGDVFANREAVGDWEKWTVQPFNGSTSTSCVNATSAIVALKSWHGKYLQPDANSDAKATISTLDMSPMPVNTTYLAISKRGVAEYYYDDPIQWNGSGSNPCPFRGRFDGANCYVGPHPSGNPFIYQNNFYYSGSSCILGTFDTKNCRMGTNPSSLSARPFIYNGNYYLTNALNSIPSSTCHFDLFTAPQENSHWNPGQARFDARQNWHNAADAQFGGDWAKWSKAKDKDLNCNQTGSFLNWETTCRASARPCKK